MSVGNISLIEKDRGNKYIGMMYIYQWKYVGTMGYGLFLEQKRDKKGSTNVWFKVSESFSLADVKMLVSDK